MKRNKKSNDGFILVAVLWILGGFAVLAAVYTLYVVNAATSLAVNDDRIQADASVARVVGFAPGGRSRFVCGHAG